MKSHILFILLILNPITIWRKKINLIFIFLCVGFFSFGSAEAATRFISGYRDGIWVYGVIERNGVQYRTDQSTSVVNMHLWNELSSEDKIKLVKTYSYMTNRLAADFGNAGQDTINAFINDQTGWSALVTEMKNKHANKDFPELAETFGDGAALELPTFNVTCWEVINSNTYRDATRLTEEVQADFEVGKAVYQMLVNANWDQIAISVKAISGPLIKIIVDTFITNFVTNGAAKTSELLANATTFVDDLRGFINDRYSEGKPQPDPAELIAKLDKYIEDMEQTAYTAKQQVAAKKTQLQSLADQLNQMETDCLQARKDAAEQTRTSLKETIKTLPAPNVPVITPDPYPPYVTTPEEKAAWDYDSMQQKCWSEFNTIRNMSNILQIQLETQRSIIANMDPQVSVPVGMGEAFDYCPNGLTSGFDGRYRTVEVPSSQYKTWEFASITSALTQSQDAYEQKGDAAEGHIDEALPQIDPLHARALGMDSYVNYMGTRDGEGHITPMDPPPSTVFANTGIRNFDSMIDIIATPAQTLTQTIEDLGTRKTILDAAEDNLPTGIDHRVEWVRDQYSKYEDLMFNFENSLSYVIAALRQIDALHADQYFLRSQYPYTIYDGVELYTYSINTDYILSQINSSGADNISRERARQAAIRRLFLLHSQEQALIQKLFIAQDSHLNDYQALSDFYDALAAQYMGYTSMDTIIEDVEEITGHTMKDPYDAWNDLIPDITYYFLGSNPGNWNWIRRNYESTNLFGNDIYGNPSAYGRISGKTETYYDMYELYNYMVDQKATLMAMTESQFNDWMTQTTIARDNFRSRLTTEGVLLPGWPAWNLWMVTQNRQEAINSEYRFGYILPNYWWRITGQLLLPDGLAGQNSSGKLSIQNGGIGIADIDLIIDGYYGEDPSGAHVTFPATTGADGAFVFEFVGTGNFTIMASSQDAKYTLTPTQVQVRDNHTVINLAAVANPDAGYNITGLVKNNQGQTMPGIPVALESLENGNISNVLTLDDGSFVFTGLAAGDWKISPLEQGFEAIPGNRTITLPPASGNLNFILQPEPVIVPGDFNNDNVADLKDLILVLQVLAGVEPEIPDLTGDIDNDGKITMVEALYLMRKISGMN